MHAPISLEAGNMSVRLQPGRAWTIDLFTYAGKQLSTPEGNNGVAVSFGTNEWVGGNHHEGGQEVVLEKELIVDGKSTAIPPCGTVKGESLVFSKRSKLRDIELKLTIELLPDRVVEHHKLTVLEDTYVDTLMAIMHCWKSSTTEYIARLPDGQTVRGELKSSGGFLLNEDVTDVAVFDPSVSIALITSFDPANPPGQGRKHTFWDLDKPYHKQYFQAIDKQSLPKGTELDFNVTVRPVPVTTEDWVGSVKF